MEKLAIQIMEWVKNGNWEIFTIFILLTFLLPIYKRLVSTDFKKWTKISKFQDLRNITNEEELVKKYLDDEIENLAFFKATGIRTNRERRIQILETFNKLNTNKNAFSIVHFKRAYGFLRFDNEKLSVHMGLLSKLFFSGLFGCGLSFLSIPIIIDVFWLFNTEAFKEIVNKVIQINIICLGYGALMFVFSFPLISTKILQKKLEKISEE